MVVCCWALPLNRPPSFCAPSPSAQHGEGRGEGEQTDQEAASVRASSAVRQRRGLAILGHGGLGFGVEEPLDFGRLVRLNLETGSKPEGL